MAITSAASRPSQMWPHRVPVIVVQVVPSQPSTEPPRDVRSRGVTAPVTTATPAASAAILRARRPADRRRRPREPSTRPDTASAPIASMIADRSSQRSTSPGSPGGRRSQLRDDRALPTPNSTEPLEGWPSASDTARHSSTYVAFASGDAASSTRWPPAAADDVDGDGHRAPPRVRRPKRLPATLIGSANQRVSADLPTATFPPFGGSDRSSVLCADAGRRTNSDAAATTTIATRRRPTPGRLRVIP